MNKKSFSLKAAGLIAAAIMMILVFAVSPVKAAELQPQVNTEQPATQLTVTATGTLVENVTAKIMPVLASVNPAKMIPEKLDGSIANQMVQLTDSISRSGTLSAKVKKVSERGFARMLAMITAGAVALSIMAAVIRRELKSV